MTNLFIKNVTLFLFQVMDLNDYCCPNWNDLTCSGKFLIYLSVITILGTLYVLAIIYFFIYKEEIAHFIKKKLGYFSEHKYTKKEMVHAIIKYSEHDEEFVLKEMLPMMKTQKNITIHMHPIKKNYNTEQDYDNLNICIHGTCNYKIIVVFSPNYLTTKYGHVDIKKIHTEMLKAVNTVYVFVDIGPENSIYAFLNSQRDEMTTVTWCVPNFWDRFFTLITEYNAKFKQDYEECEDETKEMSGLDKTILSDISFSKLPEWPVCYDINSTISSQV